MSEAVRKHRGGMPLLELWHNFGSVFVVVNAALLLRKKGEE